ncbi:hypothetical protein WN944_005673 [Citrus x changshan-huyou]|uniref:Uncharacterized protein n=1 Tax=Citrus x changshan-huyou TaxID=2935761 RepID=A0AAP0QP05_9ROSI
MYSYADLINVFEVFIPQLHLYPNPYNLLNGEAPPSRGVTAARRLHPCRTSSFQLSASPHLVPVRRFSQLLPSRRVHSQKIRSNLLFKTFLFLEKLRESKHLNHEVAMASPESGGDDLPSSEPPPSMNEQPPKRQPQNQPKPAKKAN